MKMFFEKEVKSVQKGEKTWKLLILSYLHVAI